MDNFSVLSNVAYMCLREVPRCQAPRLHRLGTAPHPQANLIPPDLLCEESAGIHTRTLVVSVGVGGSTTARQLPSHPP